MKLPKSTWVFPEEVIDNANKQTDDYVVEELKKRIDEELANEINET